MNALPLTIETLQGAGGAGGLLAVSLNNSFYFPAYDNNGNVTKYIDESGNVVAEYAYDAFGKTIAQSGTMADVFRHRYSTKCLDPETGLYYYGYRFYSPTLMRWLNRDPIGEDGGLNLYGFCGNCAINAVDDKGMSVVVIYHLIGMSPSGGWTSPFSAAETVFQLQRYKVSDGCELDGKLQFSVEIIPDVLEVHIYCRSIQSGNPMNDGVRMSIARTRESDHVAIARKLDRAFHVFKSQVESINDAPDTARQKVSKHEENLSRTVDRLLEENSYIDRRGGPHDLP